MVALFTLAAWLSISSGKNCQFLVGDIYKNYHIDVLEDQKSVGTVIGHAEAACKDGAPQFTLRPEHENARFKLGPTGTITLIRKLDYEILPSYSKEIYLSIDVSTPASSERALLHVVVHVKDINDNPPVFTSAPILAQLSESAPVGSIVTVLRATDRDSISKSISYSLQKGASSPIIASAFLLEDGNRVVLKKSLMSGDIDIDKPGMLDDGFIKLKAIASDGELMTSVHIDIRIIDFDDNLAKFSQSQYTSQALYDNMKPGIEGEILLELDAPLIVVDGDFSSGQYAYEAENASDIRISDSGEIYLLSPLLAPKKITIIAIPKGRDSPVASTVLFLDVKQSTSTPTTVPSFQPTIGPTSPTASPTTSVPSSSPTVRDENSPPIFEKNTWDVPAIPEDINYRLWKFGLTISDEDKFINNGVNASNNMFEMTPFNANAGKEYCKHFSINSETGILSLTGPLDVDSSEVQTCESGFSCQYHARVSDKYGVESSSTVNIVIMDADDNPPMCYTNDLTQIQKGHFFVHDSYRISESVDDADKPSNIQLVSSLDRATEVKGYANLGVLKILDRDCAKKNQIGFSEIDAFVGGAALAKVDLNAEGMNAFLFLSVQGKIDQKLLDREYSEYVNVSIKGKDDVMLCGVSIPLDDRNDNGPIIDEVEGKVFDFSEGDFAKVITIKAMDRDSSDDFGIKLAKFSISKTEPPQFKQYIHIDPVKGTIRLSETMDSDSLLTDLKIFVTVTDGINEPSTASIYIRIRDANNHAPIFYPTELGKRNASVIWNTRLRERVRSNASFSVARKVKADDICVGCFLFNLKASDADKTFHQLRFVVVDLDTGMPSVAFSLPAPYRDPKELPAAYYTTLMPTKPVEPGTFPIYNLLVTAADNGAPNFATSMFLQIQVTDENGLRPMPTSTPTSAPTITTSLPTSAPTITTSPPTKSPSLGPSREPSRATRKPSSSPSLTPTISTLLPTFAPTFNPSKAPSAFPTDVPTPVSPHPTLSPNIHPASSPNHVIIEYPTRRPVSSPSEAPSPRSVPHSPSRAPTLVVIGSGTTDGSTSKTASSSSVFMILCIVFAIVIFGMAVFVIKYRRESSQESVDSGNPGASDTRLMEKLPNPPARPGLRPIRKEEPALDARQNHGLRTSGPSRSSIFSTGFYFTSTDVDLLPEDFEDPEDNGREEVVEEALALEKDAFALRHEVEQMSIAAREKEEYVESMRKQEAAVKIQAQARGRIAREERKQNNAAATKIQKNYRGAKVRQEVREKQAAATNIQKYVRGRRAREEMRGMQARATLEEDEFDEIDDAELDVPTDGSIINQKMVMYDELQFDSDVLEETAVTGSTGWHSTVKSGQRGRAGRDEDNGIVPNGWHTTVRSGPRKGFPRQGESSSSFVHPQEVGTWGSAVKSPRHKRSYNAEERLFTKQSDSDEEDFDVYE